MSDMPYIKTTMDACTDAKADIDVTGHWFNYWKTQGEMKVYGTAYKNVLHDMDTVKADAGKVKDFYDAKDLYNAADMAATIAKIALPLPPSEAFLQ